MLRHDRWVVVGSPTNTLLEDYILADFLQGDSGQVIFDRVPFTIKEDEKVGII
ncbi:hypothetical protein HNQ41_002917 [Texcoconibacillus texcoconensis]|uniref:Uncharacterized protein n=1 Tax=Texcoconibacillus texcoconensis TaxID=1095777 RepID=A0A840QTM5_9BACI|nr:hypothetical protein [Texcoconibacillus texcoconensis]